MSQYLPKPFNSHFRDSIKVKIDLRNYATKTDIRNISQVDTSSFALKTNLANLKTEFDKLDIDKLAPVPVDLSKLSDVVKIPDVSSLATKTALTEVENKIPSVSSLVKKTDYDTKISELEKKLTDHNHDKYITTPEFNTLAASVFNARLSQANLITKTDFDAKL